MSNRYTDIWYENVNTWLEQIGVQYTDLQTDSKGMYITVDGDKVYLPASLQPEAIDISDDAHEQRTNV